jgi:hypothetical protein
MKSRKRVSCSEIVRDVKRVAEILGRSPTYLEYTDRGQWCGATAREACETNWNGVLTLAGLPVNIGGKSADGSPPRHTIAASDLANDLKRVAGLVGHSPYKRDYEEHGKYSIRALERRFGGWIKAVEGAGLIYAPAPHVRQVAEADLRNDLQKVHRELGRFPGAKEYQRIGKYWVGTFTRFLKRKLGGFRRPGWGDVLTYFLGAPPPVKRMPMIERPPSYLVNRIRDLQRENSRLRKKIAELKNN